MKRASAAVVCLGLLAACAGGRDIWVGDESPIIIHIRLLSPYTLARQLEELVRPKEIRPVIDLRQRLRDPDFNGAWETLEPWERQLWRDYAARGRGAVDSRRTDFHVTKSDRLLMALDLSFQHMGPGAREEGHRLIRDPAFVGGLVGGIGLYVALWIAPEPVFTKGIASTITAGLLMAFSVAEIRSFAWAWSTLEIEVGPARTLAELEQAGAKFGKAVGAQGFHVLMLIAGKLAGRAMKSIPVPAGGGGPPLAAAAAGYRFAAGINVGAGQEIWILAGGEIALVGAEAISVMMSAGGDVEGGVSKGSEVSKGSTDVDLEAHQASGGHLVAKHVGKTEVDLRARLVAEPKRKMVSTFLSRAEAKSAVSTALRMRAHEVASWVANGARERLRLKIPFKGGLVLERGAPTCVQGQSVEIVLQGDGAGGWYILTGIIYP